MAATVALLVLTQVGIAAGYHRLYSHGAYKLNMIVEAILLFFGTMAIQGTVLKWSSDHRLHHANIDKQGDPYNVKKGFWHAHVFWLFENRTIADPKIVPDLLRNKLVVFQNTHYASLAVLSNSVVCLGLGLIFHDLLGAFVLGWGLRILVSYHVTWFINSLAHYWGEQSFSKELSARDNAIIAILTVVGEGYHNYHHTFPADYRNGIRGYHFDLVKWIIWSLSKLRLARDLRSFKQEYITQRLIALDTRLLLKKLDAIDTHRPKSLQHLLVRCAVKSRFALEQQVHAIAHSLSSKRAEIALLMQQKRALHGNSHESTPLRMKARVLQQSYALEWQTWKRLCTSILGTKTP